MLSRALYLESASISGYCKSGSYYTSKHSPLTCLQSRRASRNLKIVSQVQASRLYGTESSWKTSAWWRAMEYGFKSGPDRPAEWIAAEVVEKDREQRAASRKNSNAVLAAIAGSPDHSQTAIGGEAEEEEEEAAIGLARQKAMLDEEDVALSRLKATLAAQSVSLRDQLLKLARMRESSISSLPKNQSALKDKTSLPPSGLIYISNLPHRINEGFLYRLFRVFGSIKNVALYKDENGMVLSYAHIRFATVTAAKAAVNSYNVNPIKINNKGMRVMHARARKPTSTLLIRKLPSSCDEQQLYSLFRQWGPILRTHVARNHKGHSQRYGFIQYEIIEDAIDAVDELWTRPLTFKEHTLCVHFADPQPKSPIPEGVSRLIFVNEAPAGVQAEDILQRIDTIAKVVKLYHPQRDDAATKHFCRMVFRTKRAALSVMDEHRKNPIVIRGQPLSLTYLRVPPPCPTLEVA